MIPRGTAPPAEVVGRSADGAVVVIRERAARRARNLVQTVFVYRTMVAGRAADPYGGDVLGSTGEPGLREALARLLGERGAAAVLADEAEALLRGRPGC